jgi:hypothetical protein
MQPISPFLFYSYAGSHNMGGGRAGYLREIRVVRLEDPIFSPDDDVTLVDRIAAAGREASDMQRLDWLGKEDTFATLSASLVTALIEGRKAAGIGQRKITYALNLSTIHNEATIIRLAAHTSLAPLTGPHQRGHRRAPGYDRGHDQGPPAADPRLADGLGRP